MFIKIKLCYNRNCSYKKLCSGGIMKSIFYYSFSIGDIGIAEEDGFITDIFFSKIREVQGNIIETEIIKKTAFQLEEYLSGERKEFTIPLKPNGTEFQKKVWKELCNISYGETASYGEIAEKIGSPKASRAVGMANNKNPIVIIIPCHRVIGADGSLTGYAGGIEVKKQLLDIEK